LICYTTAVNRTNLVVAKFNGYIKTLLKRWIIHLMTRSKWIATRLY
jgi:hypothetical protein